MGDIFAQADNGDIFLRIQLGKSRKKQA